MPQLMLLSPYLGRFLLLCLSVLMLLCCPSIAKAHSKDYRWYHDFYEKLSEQNILSVRYFQLWVAPGLQSGSEPVPIGGNTAHFMKWQSVVEEFLDASEYYQHIWDGVLVYEITIDKNIYAANKELFERWEAHYGAKVRISLIEDFEPVKSCPVHVAYQQCRSGVASVCSDYWRWSHANDPSFDLNIYMDVDTFTQSLSKKRYHSSQEIGITLPHEGIYVPFFDTGGILQWNTDMLIFYKPHEQHLRQIQALFANEIHQEQWALQDMAEQFQRRDLTTFEQYQQDMPRRVAAFMKYPNQNINRYSLIMKSIGPNFWERVVQRQMAYPYWYGASDDINNTMTWGGKGVANNFDCLNVQVLNEIFEFSEQELIVEMMLMAHDRGMFLRQKPSWMDDFDSRLTQLLKDNEAIIARMPHYPKGHLYQAFKQSFSCYPVNP